MLTKTSVTEPREHKPLGAKRYLSAMRGTPCQARAAPLENLEAELALLLELLVGLFELLNSALS